VTARRNLVAGWVLAVATAAAFARLGVWQLDRMHEKQAMLAAVHATLQAKTPGPLALAADVARAHDYDWAAGEGRFLDVPAVLLDNQARENVGAGVRAYRVFQPAAGGAPLLVELGWLPLPGNRVLPRVPVPANVRAVSGLLLPPPSPGLFRGAATPQADGTLLAIALQPDALRGALHLAALAPRVLKLDPAQALPAGAPPYVRDLDILPSTLPPERHLGYAVQWFGLAIAVLATALVVTFRKSYRR
jgi:cytochrome oxidase assembly protein ShyY1